MKSIILILTILACYLFFLPLHIQGGDSAEIVAAGYFKLVAHPPGYPLWSLMLQAWTHLLSAKTIFWRASLLSSMTATGALIFLARLRPFNYSSALVVGLLAFSPVFFSAAMLPDVFALHALIVAAFLFTYLKEDISAKQAALALPALFFIGFANHLTIVFLAPLLIEFIWRHRKEKKMRINMFFSSALTMSLCILLYFSLWLRQPENFYSWGEIQSLKGLWNHFLRSDYGTFQLAPHKSTSFINWESLIYFLKVQWFIWPVLIIALIEKPKEILQDKKNKAIIASLVLCVAFLAMTNFSIIGMGKEIILRFHLMPVLIILFWSQSLIKKVKNYQYAIALPFLIVAISTIIGNYSLAEDSLIERYCLDLLTSARSHNTQVIVSDNDNSYFGLRFLQLSTRSYDEINIISPPLLFHSWYQKKWMSQNSKIKIPNGQIISESKVLNFNNDIVIPNIETTSFLFTENFSDHIHYQLRYTKLGRIISKGSGIAFDTTENDSLRFTKNIEIAFGSIQGFSKKTLWSHYAHFYLAKAMSSYQKGKLNEAQKVWSEALRLVPYASPALINLCQSSNEHAQDCSTQNIESIKKESQFIFEN